LSSVFVYDSNLLCSYPEIDVIPSCIDTIPLAYILIFNATLNMIL
jgi:hypothetical protein